MNKQHPHQILRLKSVLVKLGISRSTLYDYLNERSPRHDPLFPRPLKLGARAIGWIEAELEEWLANRSRAS